MDYFCHASVQIENQLISCRLVVFLKKQNLFLIENHLSPVSNMTSSRSVRKMLTSSISNTKYSHSVDESCNFMDSYILDFVLADVIANDFGQLGFVYGRCYCHVALFCGRCYTTSRCCNLFHMVVVMLLPPG